MPEHVEIAVGKPHPLFTPPLPEAFEFLVRDDGVQLRIALHDPSASEIRAVRRGRADFAIAYVEGLIWFLAAFEPGLPWSEAPFSQWLVPEARRWPPAALEGEQRYLLHVVLLDAGTAVVRGQRKVTLTPQLSWQLRDYYSRQAQTPPIDVVEYQRRAASVQARLSTLELVRLARKAARETQH